MLAQVSLPKGPISTSFWVLGYLGKPARSMTGCGAGPTGSCPGQGRSQQLRRWKMRPSPQLRLQPLQPDQGPSTQSTAGDSTPGLRSRLMQEQDAQGDPSGQSIAQPSSSEPSWQFGSRSQRCSAGRHSPLPQVSWPGEQRVLEAGKPGKAVAGTVKGPPADTHNARTEKKAT